MADITSANSVFSLAITGLIPAAVNLDGYATDDAFEAEDIETAEVFMGVDGNLSAGFVYKEVKMAINFMADSLSLKIFETLYAAEKSQKKKFFLNATIQQPSLGVAYVLKNGVLSTYSPMAGVKRTLAPRRVGLTWQSITPGVPI